MLEALRAAVDGSVRLYPDPEAQALRARAADVYGVPADQIMVGNGSDELLALLLRATSIPGDRVAFPVPTYSLYETLVAVQGGRDRAGVPWPDDCSLPAERWPRPSARVTFVCNPNSPSGTFVPIAAVEAFAPRRVGGVLVVDEAYVDFADDDAIRARRPHCTTSSCCARCRSRTRWRAARRPGCSAIPSCWQACAPSRTRTT